VSDDEIRAAVIGELARIAPEADLAALDPEAPLREELELDSMDFLRLLAALHERLGIDVPDADAAKLATLAGAVRYLAARLGEPAVFESNGRR
jgi:acyl carrier protein